MLNLGMLLLGLGLLVLGADWLVKGGVGLARRRRVSPLVVGLTVVSFGTSLPELVVSFSAGLQHNADLAIANVIGSNIFNVLVVIGVAAIIRPLPVRDQTVVTEIPFSLTAALLVGFLANAALFTSRPDLIISRLDGLILLIFFLFFMLYVFKVARANGDEPIDEPVVLSQFKAWALIGAGVLGLYAGGELAVAGAVGVAQALGVNDALIGLTIIAAGTSAPELVASAVAAYRGQTDIAVGNVVGSNIFNLLWIIGLTATVSELPFDVVSNTDLVMVIGASALLIVALITSRRSVLNRIHGVLFVLIYIAYLAFVVHRG
ncbi:MAG: calcium/sodium antiporter [Pseudomonadales bacterium]